MLQCPHSRLLRSLRQIVSNAGCNVLESAWPVPYLCPRNTAMSGSHEAVSTELRYEVRPRAICFSNMQRDIQVFIHTMRSLCCANLPRQHVASANSVRSAANE